MRGAAGGRIAAEFTAVAEHNPTSTVRAAAEKFIEVGADGIVGFGGGSAIDCAKAVAAATRSFAPVTALSTTLSGAEFACSFGQTDDASRVKGGGRDPRLTPRAVFLDPDLTAETPARLWAGTGMRAMDHAVETVLAPNTMPYLNALAARAITLLNTTLAPSLEGGAEPRLACLFAAWMAHAGSFHITFGLSHQLGRQLGPRFNIPHGETSAILLPAVVELEQPAKAEAEALVARGLGVESGAAAGALRALVRTLKLPATLREAGISSRWEVEALFGGDEAAVRVIERAW